MREDDEYSADFEEDDYDDDYEDDFENDDPRPASRVGRMPQSPVPNVVDEFVPRPALRSPRSPAPANVVEETVMALPSPTKPMSIPFFWRSRTAPAMIKGIVRFSSCDTGPP